MGDKEALRQECSMILRKSKPPKSNLSKEEICALKSLRNNNDIVVLKTNKRGAAIILDKVDYIIKMNDHLDYSSYSKLKFNPLPKVLTEVRRKS